MVETQSTLDGVVATKKKTREFSRNTLLQELARFVAVANQVSVYFECLRVTSILMSSDLCSRLP
jgi:hypothetical protein